MKVDIQGLERDPMLRGRVGRLVGAALETIKAAPIRARVTFFDDDVINFFSPHAKDKSAIFLLAIGKPLRRKPQ